MTSVTVTMTATPERSPLKRSFGQANHFLVTLIVGLHAVKARSFSSQRWIGIYVRPPGGPDLRGSPGRLTSTPTRPTPPTAALCPLPNCPVSCSSSPSRGVVAPSPWALFRP